MSKYDPSKPYLCRSERRNQWAEMHEAAYQESTESKLKDYGKKMAVGAASFGTLGYLAAGKSGGKFGAVVGAGLGAVGAARRSRYLAGQAEKKKASDKAQEEYDKDDIENYGGRKHKYETGDPADLERGKKDFADRKRDEAGKFSESNRFQELARLIEANPSAFLLGDKEKIAEKMKSAGATAQEIEEIKRLMGTSHTHDRNGKPANFQKRIKEILEDSDESFKKGFSRGEKGYIGHEDISEDFMSGPKKGRVSGFGKTTAEQIDDAIAAGKSHTVIDLGHEVAQAKEKIQGAASKFKGAAMGAAEGVENLIRGRGMFAKPEVRRGLGMLAAVAAVGGGIALAKKMDRNRAITYLQVVKKIKNPTEAQIKKAMAQGYGYRESIQEIYDAAYSQ